MAPSYIIWISLAETVSARLVVFNKWRASEPAKLLLDQFVNRPKWQKSCSREVFDHLKPLEKVLMKRMDMVQVPGKRNRRVPILITPEVGTAMDLLVTTRTQCGISHENMYFFATTSDDGHLDSWLVLNNLARDAGNDVANP